MEERLQLAPLPLVILERYVLGVRFQEEVERVVDRHLGHEIDLDAELPDPLGEREPGHVVALRILLPVDEVLVRLDAQGIGQDRRPAMRRRSQPNELRREPDKPVVPIVGDVREGDVNRHHAYASRAARRRPDTFVDAI